MLPTAVGFATLWFYDSDTDNRVMDLSYTYSMDLIYL
jgi:hypothetical protein